MGAASPPTHPPPSSSTPLPLILQPPSSPEGDVSYQGSVVLERFMDLASCLGWQGRPQVLPRTSSVLPHVLPPLLYLTPVNKSGYPSRQQKHTLHQLCSRQQPFCAAEGDREGELPRVSPSRAETLLCGETALPKKSSTIMVH